MELICIVCPNGCSLTVTQVDGKIVVEGAKCPRGKAFASAELTCPTRTVTTSVKTTLPNYPVVSVKTDGEIPKDKIMPLMQLLSTVTITKHMDIGSIIVANPLDTGVNIILTTQMEVEHE